MKILKLSAYCSPEQVSSSHLTTDLNEALVAAGFNIENYVPTPTRGVSKEVRKKYKKIKYEELENGKIVIHRFSMYGEGKNSIQRAIRYLLVNIVQYIKGSHAKDIDVIYAGSTPPTQGLLCGLVKKRLKVPFVYNLQDIFPDSLVNAGMTRKGSFLWKIGRKIENFTYRNADKIITISDDFKRNIMEKGVPEEKIVVIPNWVNTDNVYPVEREKNILFDRYNLDRSKFYICYSGNIGHSQNLELLIEAAKLIRNKLPDIVFVLIGGGAAKEELVESVKRNELDNIVILPFQPYEDIAHVFSLGDAGLIISKPGVGGSSVPSKTWSIMAAERPILASFDRDSELSKLIEATNSGVVVEENTAEGLANAIQHLYSNQSIGLNMGKNGNMYVRTTLNKDFCTQEYVKVLKDCKEKSHA